MLCFGASAQAQSCPDFFRFVDFGQNDVNGVSRGGTLIRVESLEGRSLIKRAETACGAAQFLASDGHGNPIPVVTAITFDPEKLSFDVSGLTVRRVEDSFALAEANAQKHRTTVAQSTAAKTQGDNHLCAGAPQTTSCQLVSPLAPQAPLVVYCDAAQCQMPVLVLNDHIVISGSWPRKPNDLDATGRDVAAKLADITAFLEVLR